ncbi:MAG: 4'-phosphopantetheinyl transferase superfamily protein [Bacteroidales bacterium]|jgi:phosphopantetheine--protein transferase-like protein|nr:4'-phosphopantetheinyl transferase superfamily protein [Bacteroidales bacterium]
MIFGCGIDIEEIERFNKHYFDKGILSNLVYDIFTSKEIENFSVFGKEAFLKGFSFKEAFYKALDNTDVDFKDIEIIFSNDKDFEIFTSNRIKEILMKERITDITASFHISDQYVVFKVLLKKL